MNRALLLIACSLILLDATGCSRGEAVTPVAAMPVEVALVQRDRAPRSGSLAGRIEAWRASTISGEVAERVMQRPVRRGDRVSRGQLLVLFREDTAAEQLAQAEAVASRATAALRQAEAGLARARVETQASVTSAQAGVTGATAQATKAGSYTRSQELRSAEAALSAARADEELAHKELARYRTLVAEDAAPRQSLDRAQAACEAAEARRRSAEQTVSLAREGARREDQTAARAQLRQARASLEAAQARPFRLAELEAQVDGLRAQVTEASAAASQARIRLGKCRVVAPFDGVVLDTRIEVGELATPGHPLVKLGEVRQVKAVFAVTEAARAQLKLGQALDVTVDALGNRRFHGRLHVLGAEADARTRAFPVEVAIDNANTVLLPNMIARLELLSRPASPPLVVPLSAVVNRGAATQVFVVRGDAVEARTIRLGQPRGDGAEVLEGLAEGERVALNPVRLANGQKVMEVKP